ncbi:MAG: hypothetical protein WCH65_07050 [bacterium]
MKKILLVVALCVALCNIQADAQKASKQFKTVVKTYQKQTKWYLEETFALIKTGPEIDTTIRAIMESVIYESFLSDFANWAKFIKKCDGEKKFNFKVKPIKGFETEGSEYINQFKLLQKQFVDKRFIVNKEDLKKILSKEKLQLFIDEVMKKFEDRTKELIEKLKA